MKSYWKEYLNELRSLAKERDAKSILDSGLLKVN